MKMQKPEMEFIEFNTNDVIATSGGEIKLPYNGHETTPPINSPAEFKGWGGWFTNQDTPYNQ